MSRKGRKCYPQRKGFWLDCSGNRKGMHLSLRGRGCITWWKTRKGYELYLYDKHFSLRWNLERLKEKKQQWHPTEQDLQDLCDHANKQFEERSEDSLGTWVRLV